ncbi:hypothetical protein BCR33DRAFT_779231 [Rhizoclosmatium globosum]|uniref:Uncharacterized protein n=1 Tax=Rhizoclosmatium globosum TaxID=329046 RepID=A0A1Y2D0P1_9FUNG|nr:hypothetical protein BCR33DRAFT_779231 [Rhizoclosmatium globosum]|eukprot:ORY52842.1 hypothetical protein BCR33DRAFT_779231 [Rhizoclosmatium globosum]
MIENMDLFLPDAVDDFVDAHMGADETTETDEDFPLGVSWMEHLSSPVPFRHLESSASPNSPTFSLDSDYNPSKHDSKKSNKHSLLTALNQTRVSFLPHPHPQPTSIPLSSTLSPVIRQKQQPGPSELALSSTKTIYPHSSLSLQQQPTKNLQAVKDRHHHVNEKQHKNHLSVESASRDPLQALTPSVPTKRRIPSQKNTNAKSVPSQSTLGMARDEEGMFSSDDVMRGLKANIRCHLAPKPPPTFRKPPLSPHQYSEANVKRRNPSEKEMDLHSLLNPTPDDLANYGFPTASIDPHLLDIATASDLL